MSKLSVAKKNSKYNKGVEKIQVYSLLRASPRESLKMGLKNKIGPDLIYLGLNKFV